MNEILEFVVRHGAGEVSFAEILIESPRESIQSF